MSDEKPKSNDKDLDELLDSALKDFDKQLPTTTDQSSESKQLTDSAAGDTQEIWNDDFFAEQAKLLADRMNGIFGPADQQPSPDQMHLGFEKLAEAAALALQGDVPVDDVGAKYADSITEALKGLKEGVDNLQAPVSETEVANMFSGLVMGDNTNNENPFLPFMQGMMQSLLSAEILLPSIKELLEKYPKYLEENADKLSAEDKDRYEKQLGLFKSLSIELESENPDDSQTIKQERFKKILDNMQKLHEFGQPPEELIADVGSVALPGLEGLAGGGLASNNQCPTM